MISDNLYEKVKRYGESIKNHEMGASPIPKCFLMSYLINRMDFKNYVEIGVFQGRSLFSVAPALKDNQGVAYGVDPYCPESFVEEELSETVKRLVDDYVVKTDFNQLFWSVLEKKTELELDDVVKIIRKKSEDAVEYFCKRNIMIDMLHIDGNHDEIYVRQDANNYIPLVRDGGIIVFDDIDFSGVRTVYEEEKQRNQLLFETGKFGILIKSQSLSKELKEDTHVTERDIIHLRNMLPYIYYNVEHVEDCGKKPHVYVGVLCYNFEDKIEDCLKSIVCQKGDFDLSIYVFDDKSSDNSLARVYSYIENLSENINIFVVKNQCNLGVSKNLQQVIDVFKNGAFDFMSIIDGDDEMISSYRIQAHIDYLNCHPECALSFNRMIMAFETTGELKTWTEQNSFNRAWFTSFDLAKDNFIGNIGCSVIRKNAVKYPEGLFSEAGACDWLMHVCFSEQGDIGLVDAYYNRYNKWSGGMWSPGNSTGKNERYLLASLMEFNRITSYMYYADNIDMFKRLVAFCGIDESDILIIDDVFPTPKSGFRYEEFSSYLNYFDNIKILLTGLSLCALKEAPLYDIIKNYLIIHPEFYKKIIPVSVDYTTLQVCAGEAIHAKLAYCCFAGNIFYCLDLFEKNKIPFVFELYPGGSFTLNDPESDTRLERIFSSPMFRRVITTQRVSRDYIIEKGYCPEEKIEHIFGVVSPAFDRSNVLNRTYYGAGKDTLDICFVAYKYTEKGIDKGYDVFIDVAKRLGNQYANVVFHIVGPWDADTISTKGIENILFYGAKSSQELAEFYTHMDIILSPNVNDIIKKGAFDGFPTASVTEASLYGVLMMVTDPLELNDNHFADGEEIIIVPHNAGKIFDIIVQLHENPSSIEKIAKKGRAKVLDLYGCEKQIVPRIRILEKELELKCDDEINGLKEGDVEDSHDAVRKKIEIKPVLWIVYREFVPNIIQRVYRGLKHGFRGFFSWF